MNFGAKLRALRSSRGMTLKVLAANLGYSTHGYLSEIESGSKQPTVMLVLKVAELFQVTTDVLLKDDLRLPNPGNKRRI
jgi:transcriptional regulator with XRE-family HTH domain